jgi:cytoskeletal protein RodZ
MKTIGQILKDARVKKKYSLKKLGDITKIRSEFIESVEKGKWESLPPFPTVLGFVKSVSAPLDIDEKMAVAVLKRDYPPKKLNINPKPDISSKFVWSPKLTFSIGIALAALLIFGYLGFQYFRFISPPRLSVESPKESQIVSGNSVLVFGSTEGDAKITVNNQPVLVSEDGKFSVSIGVAPETHEIVIKAISRSGKETIMRRTITVRQ